MKVQDAIIYMEGRLTEAIKWLIRTEEYVDTGQMLYETHIKVDFSPPSQIKVRLVTTDYFKYVESYRENEMAVDTLVEMLYESDDFKICKDLLLQAYAEELKLKITKELTK